MALQLIYWEPDGFGQAEIRHVNLKRTDEIPALIESRPARTCLITIIRSDKQSPTEKIVWTKPGYTDPVYIPRTEYIYGRKPE